MKSLKDLSLRASISIPPKRACILLQQEMKALFDLLPLEDKLQNAQRMPSEWMGQQSKKPVWVPSRFKRIQDLMKHLSGADLIQCLPLDIPQKEMTKALRFPLHPFWDFLREWIPLWLSKTIDVNHSIINNLSNLQLILFLPEMEKNIQIWLENGGKIEKSQLVFCIDQENPTYFKILLNHQKELAIQDVEMLQKAIEKYNLEIVKLLVKAGVDVNLLTSFEITPLRLALQLRHEKIANYLKNVGALENLQTQQPFQKEKPLDYWISLDQAQKVQHWVSNKKPVHFQHLEKAIDLDVPHLFQILVPHVPLQQLRQKSTQKGYTLLHHAIEKGDSKMVKILLDLGSDVNKLTSDGESPLFLALSHPSIVKLLVKSGANIHQKIDDMNYLVFADNLDSLKYLVKAGLSPNEQDESGNTVIFYTDNPQKLEKLVELGANVNHQNVENQTALFSTENLQKIQTLLSLGADPFLKDNQGKNVLEYLQEQYPIGTRYEEIQQTMDLLAQTMSNILDELQKILKTLYRSYLPPQRQNLQSEFEAEIRDQNLVCPIGFHLMTFPVKNAVGVTYDLENIDALHQKTQMQRRSHYTDPSTRRQYRIPYLEFDAKKFSEVHDFLKGKIEPLLQSFQRQRQGLQRVQMQKQDIFKQQGGVEQSKNNQN